MAIATFGAGCFWGVEATFQKINGVTETVVGFMGGTVDSPTYEDVYTDQTGHAEVVQVTYDPSRVNYEDLLDIFWNNHNPTSLNRQGPDVGTRYRSVIFYHDQQQKRTAEQSRQSLAASGRFKRPIVTEIVPATTFYKAEDYHQNYLEKQGLAACHI